MTVELNLTEEDIKTYLKERIEMNGLISVKRITLSAYSGDIRDPRDRSSVSATCEVELR